MNEKGIIIVKIGSGVVVLPNGDINYTRVSQIFSDIINVLNLGYKVVVVTSGAVAAGRFRIIHAKGVPKSHQRQFFSSVGQPRLLQFYAYIAMQHGKIVSQILVSRDSFANRIQYFSIRDTIRNLLNNDIIPIINNNDVLHREDLDFSDNDHLSAYLGGMLNTERVVFLSSVKGVYKQIIGRYF